MRVRAPIALAAFVAALAASTVAQSGVIEFVCSISGEVSRTCCCAPKADEGCAAIERDCSCCDVSFTAPAPQPAAQTAPATAVHVPATMVMTEAIVSFESAPASIAMDRAPARRSSRSVFLLNQSFRC